MGNIAVRRADNRAYLTRIKTVFKVVVNELIGCGNNYCAYLVKRKNCKPELIMALENKHYPVAFLDAERKEVIRRH